MVAAAAEGHYRCLLFNTWPNFLVWIKSDQEKQNSRHFVFLFVLCRHDTLIENLKNPGASFFPAKILIYQSVYEVACSIAFVHQHSFHVIDDARV